MLLWRDRRKYVFIAALPRNVPQQHDRAKGRIARQGQERQAAGHSAHFGHRLCGPRQERRNVGSAIVWAWLTQWISWHSALIVVGLLVYVLATQGLHQRRPPSAAIAWVLLIALLPYLGVPLFLLFGTRKLRRAPALPAPNTAQSAAHPEEGDPLDAMARALRLPDSVSHGRITLHEDGTSALRALFDVISQARKTLHICTYVIGNDAIGTTLLERVRESVAAGVTVRILVDGVGGFRSWSIVHRLRKTGAQTSWFVPPLHRPLHGRTNLRNHRKLVIADSSRVWSGGRNLAQEYFTGATGVAPWIDLSFDTDGPLAASLDRIFLADWSFAVGRGEPNVRIPEPGPTQSTISAARPVPSGPDFADDTLHALLLLACYRARSSIRVATPYFVPDESLLRALCLAAQRGVQVHLLLPARSNHRLADLGRRRPLLQMDAAGAQVHMLASMMHAKMVLIDDSWLLLGSANMDARSLFLNYELMVELREPAMIASARAWFTASESAAQLWKAPSSGTLRDLGDGLLLWLAFQL